MYNRKRQKNMIIGGLLAIVCIMAIGYAAFASNLNISGSGAISSNWDIEITGIRGANPFGGDAYDISQPTYTPTTATFNTGLKTPGVDERFYEIEISNLGTLAGKVTIANLSCGNNSAIEYHTFESYTKIIDDEGNWGGRNGNELEFYDGTDNYTDINFTIAPGSKHYLYINVWYSDDVTSQPENLSANIKLELTYEQANLDSNGIAIPPITGTVYRWTTDGLYIGNSITGVETTTNPSTLNKNYYLKHEVVDDIITSSYVCFVTDTEHCMQGGNESYYETNKALLQSQESWFMSNGGSCNFYDDTSYCDRDSLYVRVKNSGYVYVSDREGMECSILSDGQATCTIGGGDA